ncbi:MAG: hypothetical protein GFH23_1086610n193 [Chloroflexi bacterium AL-N1]|nr:hypothetical protein [Chloroflexi bacterium AL-N1]
MIKLLTMFVKALIVFGLIIGSAIPFSAHAAPNTETTLAPSSDQLMSDGMWICTNEVPPGWIATMANTGIGGQCGAFVEWYIIPLTPGWSGWVCNHNEPAGWIRTMANTGIGGQCGAFVEWYIIPLTPGWSGWICSNTAPPGWIVTQVNTGIGGQCGAYVEHYIQPI